MDAEPPLIMMALRLPSYLLLGMVRVHSRLLLYLQEVNDPTLTLQWSVSWVGGIHVPAGASNHCWIKSRGTMKWAGRHALICWGLSWDLSAQASSRGRGPLPHL